jgi:predicted RNase H-like HicB family nuclease
MEKEEFNVTIEIWNESLSDGTTVYVALARELEVTSQGETFEDAQRNICEAVLVFLENASQPEIDQYLQPIRRRRHVMASRARVEMEHGQAQNFVAARGRFVERS